MQFFHIGPSKNGPGPLVFSKFQLKMRFSPQRRAIFRHRTFKKSKKCASRHSGVQFFDIRTSKSAPAQFFNILASKCAFRHSGVQFFDIGPSKSAPGPSVFFAKMSSENVLLATAACNFSTSELPKVFPRSFLTFWLQNVLFATATCNF